MSQRRPAHTLTTVLIAVRSAPGPSWTPATEQAVVVDAGSGEVLRTDQDD